MVFADISEPFHARTLWEHDGGEYVVGLRIGRSKRGRASMSTCVQGLDM
jgi:hypothetical protein